MMSMFDAPGFLLKWVALCLLCAPLLLVSYAVAGLFRLWCGTRSYWRDGAWVVVLDERSWFVRRLYSRWGGTALGLAMIAREVGSAALREKIVRHELVHVEQFQGGAVAAWLVAPLWWLGWFGGSWGLLALFLALPFLFYAGSGLAAWLRGESFYAGNSMEESARAQTDNKGDR